MKIYNTCENKKCGIYFDYIPNTSYLIEKGKILKVCNSCNDLEISLRILESSK